MKFNLNDFMQLDTKALLAVNGGTHCGGESSYPCGGSSGSSSYGARGVGGQNGLTADLPINDTTSLTAGIGLGTATIGGKIQW